MPNLTVTGLNDEIKRELRVRATNNGRSMAAEARAILTETLIADTDERGLASAIHDLVLPYGGLEIEIPLRQDFWRADSR